MSTGNMIDRLIEAVEAGDDAGVTSCLFDSRNCNHIESAYRGSLDAALALHEALLPGWVYVLTERSATVLERGNGFETMVKEYGTTARAWLIAILKAYRDLIK